MVITIIVLLILAGVALATLTGQGNIIGNAENAVGKYNNSVASEQQFLNEIEKYFQNYLEGGNNSPKPIESPEVDENGLATENTTITTDGENVQIVIPKGFAPVILNGSNSTYSLPGQDGSVKEIMPEDQWYNITAEQINQGIVIVDHAITYTDGVQDFNEYVWIPIPKLEEDFERTAWTTLEEIDNLTDSAAIGAFWEETTLQEYQEMLASINYYKGFYIGRYEASEGSGNIAQSKRGVSPWINESQKSAIDACANHTTEKMHLIYGIEWDSVLNWLIGKAIISSSVTEEQKTMELEDIQNNSCSWGNYRNSIGDAEVSSGAFKQNTGTSEYWKANNIYDLAGNVFEWTQEKFSTEGDIVPRGGHFYSGLGLPVAVRGTSWNAENIYNYVRISLQLFYRTER